MKIKQIQGFTLIEVIIVVAIIGILSSIAFSSYSNHIISANRTDGRSALTTASASLEKCRALYGSYNNANCNVTLPFNSVEGHYAISGAPTATTFTLTATPNAGPQTKDTECTTITLTNTGVQGGTGTDITECW